jgi:DNA-binding beta-propeller fold protein YncE
MGMKATAVLVLATGLGMVGFAGCDGCGDSGQPAVDARRDGPADAAADVPAPDSAPQDAAVDRVTDAPAPDVAAADARDGATADAIVHSCGAFSTPSQWTTAAGFRSAVVAMGAPLSQPVAISFAAGPYGESAYVVDQGARAVFRIDTRTGTVVSFVAAAAWPRPPGLLTTSVWDADGAFDGRLYVGDQGSDGDNDSVIFRVDPAGTATVFSMAPAPAMAAAPGLDDIYGLAFSPGGGYPPGLYVSGDTDGASAGFGRYDAAGVGAVFAMFAGVEGLAIDKLGRFGGGLFASMPAGGGYSGDDTISKINPDGSKATPPLVMAQPGIHALVFAPNGPFGGDAYAASWSTGKLLRITPAGVVSELATGLSLTNYDGNILSFSPDGRVLFVADRAMGRIVCIEPM